MCHSAFRTRAALALGAVLLVTGLTLAVAATNGAASPVIPATESWPPFVLVYQDTQTDRATGASGITRFQLEYTDRRHWRATLIDNPERPDTVGSTWVFDGDTMSSYDTHFNRQRVTTYGPDQQLIMDEWLGPDRIPMLTKKPNARGVQALGNGLAVLTQAETYLHPDTNKAVQWRREITYRVGDELPTRMVETVDGVEVRRWEALELRVGSR